MAILDAGRVARREACEIDAASTSPRIARLRTDVMARGGSFVRRANPIARDVALYRAAASDAGYSTVQIRAAALLELARSATIDIGPDWRLVGEHLPHNFGLVSMRAMVRPTHLSELEIGADELADVEDVCRRWATHQYPYTAIGEPNGEYSKGAWDAGHARVFRGTGWIENHSIRDYARVLRMGFLGIRREIEAHMRGSISTDPEYPERESFWRAALRVFEAAMVLAERYADLAQQQGRTEMAALCRRVPVGGAGTFLEATQALWFAHIVTCGEDGINANSLGRLDQILLPYYDLDRREGRITREEAVEIMVELACKLYLDYDVQAITLGGVDRDGVDAVNEMSYIILDATERAGFVRDVSVRVNRHSPSQFIDQCTQLVARGGGIPFFFNEECFIKALTDRGIDLSDARDFAPIGCIELTIPGRANPHAVSGWFNGAKCLELALFDGTDPRTGEQIGPRTGTLADHGHYEDLVRAFRTHMEFFAKNMVYAINRGELAQRERGPLPCWSVLTDDCIVRGRDITDGGAVYNYHSVCFLGTANIADSLLAVKKLVFAEKRVSATDLLVALRKDYEGCEPLRQLLLRLPPKYGNDVDEVDEIACWVTDSFIDLMDTFRSPLGGRFFVHLFSFLANIEYGRDLGATPDGRRAGEPIAYSLSPHQGRDVNGVTALLSSLAKLPHHRAAGATAAIIDLDPKLVVGEAGAERLAHIVRAAVNMGVGQMQFNVVTRERLLQAQHDPENVGNIPVRVAGYSQKFNLLTKELQDHVIARTKHTSQ